MFFSDADYEAYLALMAGQCAARGAAVRAWSLLPNRVHLVAAAETPEVGATSTTAPAAAVKAAVGSQAPAGPDGVDAWRHFYYNADWQVLETRRTSVCGSAAPG